MAKKIRQSSVFVKYFCLKSDAGYRRKEGFWLFGESTEGLSPVCHRNCVYYLGENNGDQITILKYK
jgi:hypothetical protein